MSFLSNRQISDLCLRLGTLLHAGLPLSEAGRLIRHQDTEVNKVIKTVSDRSCLGETLYEIMASTGKFPSYVTGLLETGDRAGKTEEALSALSSYYERQAGRERRLRSAVLYPALLLVLMLGIIVVLLVKVLPVFDSVYGSLGTSMTGIAGALLKTGRILGSLTPVLGAVLIIAFLCAALFVWNGTVRSKLTAAFLKKFGDRGVLRKLNDAKIAQALAMGLHSGMTLDGAIEMASGLIADVPSAAKRCKDCAELLRTDAKTDWVLGNSRILPKDACEMLYLGQRSGQLDAVSDHVSQRLSDDAEAALDSLIGKIEPAMVLAAAFLVGMILIAVMLPLMDIMSSIA